MPLLNQYKRGMSKRIKYKEDANGGNAEQDREPVGKRLAALETLVGLAATGADKIRNNRRGFQSRMKAIETA